MSLPYRCRRATLEDLGALTTLWQTMRFDTDDLSRRVTEFQVAEDAQGTVLGCVGLQLGQKQGLVHSEAFTDFGLAEQLRPLLWDRIQSVAANHGLHRIWTRESAPFWTHCGMLKADEEDMAKLPQNWRSHSGPWLTLKLKEELDQVLSADKEFALFIESEKERTQRALQQARMLKVFATIVAFGVFILVIIGVFFLMKKNPQVLPH